MAGKGPPPKNPATRRRRNKPPTSATLDPDGGRKRAPALPPRKKPGWHLLVRAWWRDVWASPMAAKFLQADVHALYMLADLRDRYWRGEAELAAEIRLREERFGLTPMDRARMHWEIHEKPKPAPEAPRPQEPAPLPPSSGEDPRRVLAMVPRKRA